MKDYQQTLMGFLLALFVVVIDQLSKVWIFKALAQTPRVQITSFLDLVLLFNRGISFGFLNSPQANVSLLIVVALLISLILMALLVRTNSILTGCGLGLILGGAIGNVIDRFKFSSVVDFIYVHWHEYSFPAFNIADSAITIGVILIILEGISRKKGEI